MDEELKLASEIKEDEIKILKLEEEISKIRKIVKNKRTELKTKAILRIINNNGEIGSESLKNIVGCDFIEEFFWF